jgi:uncharacterized membrane protein
VIIEESAMSVQQLNPQSTQYEMTRQGVRNLDRLPRTLSATSATEKKASAASLRNVGESERAFSLVAGAAIMGAGISMRSLSGLIMGLVGSGLVYRGITGRCQLYNAFGIRTVHHAKAATE